DCDPKLGARRCGLLAKLRHPAEDEKRNAANGKAETPRHHSVRQLVQNDGEEKSERPRDTHDEIGAHALMRDLQREIARAEREHEIEREEEPRDVDAHAEAEQREKADT